MKPDWDKLMKNWNKSKRSKDGVIADVDCTAEGGKELCEKHGVKGFPTIKWGDPNSLEDYSGGRDYDALKKFALSKIKPMCTPGNLDLCDEEKKKAIAELQAMPPEDLTANIEEKQKQIKDAEEDFDKKVKELQEQYQQLEKAKEEAISAVKSSGLGLMLSVQAHANRVQDKDEL
mmetsp:Transcript_67034/g.155585  ORF Transcript_67034/g.155585 Transcript_67034/m.155585 type:complete len:175 (-) Transcript_67034:78-602(-)|eukprot:CAMPEP_0171091118 /NCGR_PEP_ID=MMETSP0766_2-20121228/32246_1 /TAXON_ID=439317 /ORGANISM="Gambierdiscus australes, Strain CAWD 149" /LENGTH=174 /DNA_ID=CAMNT_0011549181 /DNA_START=221 /DNA_END=745 /DNA_ORIENTATION=+